MSGEHPMHVLALFIVLVSLVGIDVMAFLEGVYWGLGVLFCIGVVFAMITSDW